jgi:hypothetical protein
MAAHAPTRSDRDLQDALITYLADASARSASAVSLPLSAQQAERAGKFARFLARRYYRDRLARSFRHSRRFAGPAEAIVDTAAFDAFLGDCVLGSLASAERVAQLAVDRLQSLSASPPWWHSLLQYEQAFFLQAATTANGAPAAFPRQGASAQCRRFSWNLPELLLRLKAGEPVNNDLRHEVTLLFSRTHLGRIYVVEVDEAMAAIYYAADGSRSPAQIAEATSLPIATVQTSLDALIQIGALVTSS